VHLEIITLSLLLVLGVKSWRFRVLKMLQDTVNLGRKHNRDIIREMPVLAVTERK